MNYESWIMSASLNSYSLFIKHNRFIVYLINGNFLLQYTIYIIYRFLFLYYILYWQSFKDQSLRFSESGCKITAFSRHDQISWKIFWIIFVTHWFSVPIFLSSHPHFFQYLTEHTLVFRESGCKGTAFLWYNQIFMQKFYIFFVIHWLPKYVVKHKNHPLPTLSI